MADADTFHHPYKPYDIQTQLMQQIYRLLEDGKKVGIFESPTGTGKTLSLICSTVTWLRRNKALLMNQENRLGTETQDNVNTGGSNNSDDDDDDDDDEPAWVKEAFTESVLKEKIRALDEYEKHLDSKSFTKKAATLLSKDIQPKTKRSRNLEHTPVQLDDTEFLPEEEAELDFAEDVNSDLQQNDKMAKLSHDVQALLGKLEDATEDKPVKEAALHSPVKIFFASRTHSQLSQFAQQLRLPDFPPSFESMSYERIKFAPLASRKQLCINPKVSKVPSHIINDYCLDAVNKKQCAPYTRSKEPEHIRTFRDNAFYAIHDIEDMVAIGQATETCPYYALRELLHDGVEIITLPYQHLLMENTRQSLGIDLKGSIVIIDEAHNVIDTINMINSAEISFDDLQKSKLGIAAYSRRFAKRLSPKNRVNLRRLSTLIDILSAFLEKNYKNGREFDSIEIFDGTNADTLNIHKLETYMKKTKIAYKIDSYIQSQLKVADDNIPHKQPILFKVAAFLRTLSNPSLEGQFFFEKGKTMKYMLLEPSHNFKSIVQEAKCVILAGGTMEPVSDFTNDLIPFVKDDQIAKFSCNHVIPDDNLNTFIVGDDFSFTFDKREDTKMLGKLYEFLLALCNIVPDGVVVFLPSYKFLDSIMSVWRNKGKLGTLLGPKKIFCESADQPDIFSRYVEQIRVSGQGAILFAVVGGRLSEGINFQDELARAVVMIGLPYPNLFSGELIIKRKHLERKVLKAGGSELDAKKATSDFYENICMKAVNQSIGRAIRHAKDYANIYLVDKRYSSLQTQQKLSAWVSRRIQPSSSIKETLDRSLKWYYNKSSKPTAE